MPSLRRFAEPVADDVEHQRVQTKRRAEVETDARPLLGELSTEAAQILSDVRASREKVRQQQDSRRTERDATLCSLRDRWLGEFEVRRLDDMAGEAGAELLGELEQVGISGSESAAVCDQQDGGARVESHVRLAHERHGCHTHEGFWSVHPR